MWYVADGCINNGQLAYFSSFTIVDFTIVGGVMEHLIENNITLQSKYQDTLEGAPKTAHITPQKVFA